MENRQDGNGLRKDRPKAAFIQKGTGNGNATATQWKLELLKRDWLVYSRQFTEVFILNQLQFAATEYDSIY